MDKPERSSYNAIDFVGWRRLKSLEISPKFQRRSVWTRPAQSYLIDTLILGFPVPPIFIRVAQSADGSRSVREIIDGQQRMRAVLDFIDGGYALSWSVKSPYGGKTFDELPEDVKNKIRYYSFISEVFYGITDEEVLSIFARLNTNAIRLNAQELRNGKFFGHFKETVYSLALEHLTFWRNSKLFGERGIARMQEAEFTSELLIMSLAGMQDKKASINDFYERYDEKFVEKATHTNRFKRTIDAIGESVGDILKATEFRRTPLFYSLFAAVYDRMYGLRGFAKAVKKGETLSKSDSAKLRDAVLKLSGIVRVYKEDEEGPPRGYQAFVTACLQQTDNIAPRRTRYSTVFKEAFLK